MNSILSWFSGVKAYVLGALSLLIGVLVVGVKILLRQKSDARKKAAKEIRRRQEVEELRRRELDIRDAKNRVERRRKENERAEKKRIDNDIRPEHWSDRRIRLRKKN